MSRHAFPVVVNTVVNERGLTKLEYATLMLASAAVHIDINKDRAERLAQSARIILDVCQEREGVR